MTKPYLGKLQIEANVPNQNIINDFINVTVNFEIICPNCGPKDQKIKKNGHDVKLEGKPQIFYCNNCNKSFFAHTSWIFKEFTSLVIEKVITGLFIENLSPKSISKMFGLSSSLISKIRYQCFNLLKQKVSNIRLEAKNEKKFKDLPLVRQSGIWWDETFFKVNGSSYFLILIINALGEVLGYKFSKTRNEVDYLSILTPIMECIPETPIFICDGNPTYEGVVKSLQRKAFLIQHIHSKPWKDAKLHLFEPNEKDKSVNQTTISLPYDAFLKDKDIQMNAAMKTTIIKEPEFFKRKRGRPKGKKDSKKRPKYGTVKEKMMKRSLKKPGRQNLEEKGAQITFNPDPYVSGWNLKLIKNASKKNNLMNPDMKNVKTLLDMTYEIMNGGAIQSNFIESKNSVVKRFLFRIGLKNIYQYDYLLGANLLSKGEMKECYWNDSIFNSTFNNSLGFSKLLTLFSPDISKIEVL